MIRRNPPKVGSGPVNEPAVDLDGALGGGRAVQRSPSRPRGARGRASERPPGVRGGGSIQAASTRRRCGLGAQAPEDSRMRGICVGRDTPGDSPIVDGQSVQINALAVSGAE